MQGPEFSHEAELLGAKRRLARLKERHLKRRMQRAGRPMDAAALRELRADVLEGGRSPERGEGAEAGPQSQALRALQRLVAALLADPATDLPLSSKQIHAKLSQGPAADGYLEALSALAAAEGDGSSQEEKLESVLRDLGSTSSSGGGGGGSRQGDGGGGGSSGSGASCLEVEAIDVGGRTAVMVLGVTNRGRLASLAGLPPLSGPLGGTLPQGTPQAAAGAPLGVPLLPTPPGLLPGMGLAARVPGPGGPSPLEQLTPTPRSAPSDLQQLLSRASTMERQKTEKGVELLGLIEKPTARESAVVEQFRSEGGSSIREYCPHLTKDDCRRANNSPFCCPRLHFLRLLFPWTDPSLGNCSYLDTCRHMKSCKYVHYELDDRLEPSMHASALMVQPRGVPKYLRALEEPQWINCDVRSFDLTILGKFGVIMTDPPWEIHQELPYGTMADDEMRNLNISCLQDEGVIVMWVTGRAMELGRECLQLWGYSRVDELIWVKTNQLQRLIRTGRTGHWLNHSKEHALVGIKGNPPINRNVDCDVVVAEVRETSRKPDEMYPLLERLWPGARKVEIFARQHNLRPGWVGLGNQLDGTRIVDPELKARYEAKYGKLGEKG